MGHHRRKNNNKKAGNHANVVQIILKMKTKQPFELF